MDNKESNDDETISTSSNEGRDFSIHKYIFFAQFFLFGPFGPALWWLQFLCLCIGPRMSSEEDEKWAKYGRNGAFLYTGLNLLTAVF